MSRVVTLAIALLAVGCVDDGGLFVPAPDVAEAPVWVNDGGLTLAFRQAEAELLNAGDPSGDAEWLAYYRRRLAVSRLELQVLRGPNGPAFAAAERREREDAFRREYPAKSRSPGWLEAFTDHMRNATVPGLTEAVERRTERLKETIRYTRKRMARAAAAKSDSCGSGDYAPNVSAKRPHLMGYGLDLDRFWMRGGGSQTSSKDALHRMTVGLGSWNDGDPENMTLSSVSFGPDGWTDCRKGYRQTEDFELDVGRLPQLRSRLSDDRNEK